MEISKQGAEFIAGWESFRDKAYQDSGGTWTLGFGTTRYPDGSRVKEGDTCTPGQAVSWFQHDLKSFGLEVERLVKRHLSQHEFDALVSFRYNAGTSYKSGGQWRLYNIWKLVVNQTITPEYWQNLAITSGGKVLNGLKRRRKAEAELYFNGKY